MSKVRSNAGFTLVELLIVIVVIAILASISMITYGGIQQRARNTALTSDARKMKSLVEQYVAINGADAFRSLVPTSTYYCLGEGFIDLDPGPDNACYIYNDSYYSTPGTVTSSSALDNALMQLGDYSISGMPPAEWSGEYTYSGSQYTFHEISSGPEIYRHSVNHRVDGERAFASLWYHLEGDNKDCGLRPVLRYINYENPISNYTINHNYVNSGYVEDATFCSIHIPVP